MKKVLIIALVLLMSVCCFASCDAIEQEIGKAVSVAAVDAVATELSNQGVEFTHFSEEEIADFLKDWETEFGAPMAGELTSGLTGAYENEETGAWVEYYVYGFSSTEDATKLDEFLREEYAQEISAGTTIVINGGYIVNLTRSSEVIEVE